jgi:hypothetical protein
MNQSMDVRHVVTIVLLGVYRLGDYVPIGITLRPFSYQRGLTVVVAT